MAIEKNMRNNLPSFIVAQDVKSGYNNVVIDDLLTKFTAASNKYYSSQMQEEEDGVDLIAREQEGIQLLLQYITKTPRLKIWQNSSCIFIMKGVLQGGITSPYLFILAADDLT